MWQGSSVFHTYTAHLGDQTRITLQEFNLFSRTFWKMCQKTTFHSMLLNCGCEVTLRCSTFVATSHLALLCWCFQVPKDLWIWKPGQCRCLYPKNALSLDYSCTLCPSTASAAARMLPCLSFVVVVWVPRTLKGPICCTNTWYCPLLWAFRQDPPHGLSPQLAKRACPRAHCACKHIMWLQVMRETCSRKCCGFLIPVPCVRVWHQ